MFWQIRATAGPLTGTAFPLSRSLTIGRAGGVGVQLISGLVSRAHAEIRCDPDGAVTLVDLNSKNGTFVKGERVQSCPLHEGESFEIGSSSFCLEQVEAPVDEEHTLRLSLLSGPAEDETCVIDAPAELKQTVATTVLPEQSERCTDPLHTEAANRGWRFCPVCGADPHAD